MFELRRECNPVPNFIVMGKAVEFEEACELARQLARETGYYIVVWIGSTPITGFKIRD